MKKFQPELSCGDHFYDVASCFLFNFYLILEEPTAVTLNTIEIK